jgi:hypothetical protein
MDTDANEWATRWELVWRRWLGEAGRTHARLEVLLYVALEEGDAIFDIDLGEAVKDLLEPHGQEHKTHANTMDTILFGATKYDNVF